MITSELPIGVHVAAGMARKPEVMAFVMSPLLRCYRMEVPERVEVGTHGKARLWWFGMFPGWTHHITVERLDPLEIRTSECGGPVRTWQHHLRFVPLGEQRCRYTDEIETDDGWHGALIRVFVRFMFRRRHRHRHRRWQLLARMLG